MKLKHQRMIMCDTYKYFLILKLILLLFLLQNQATVLNIILIIFKYKTA